MNIYAINNTNNFFNPFIVLIIRFCIIFFEFFIIFIGIIIDIFGLLILGLSLVPENYAISQSFENTIYPHLVIAVAFFLGVGLLVIANLKRRKEDEHEKTS